MGAAWDGMGSYFGEMTVWVPGRFLDGSGASRIPLKAKILQKSGNSKILYFNVKDLAFAF